MNLAYFSLGSNLGDREQFLREAIQLLSKKIGAIRTISPVYETPPLGFESKHSFLNLCLGLETSDSPESIIKIIAEIEDKLGRKRDASGEYTSRTIDIDLILFGSHTLDNETLSVPHPRFRDRLFVLRPLADIAENEVDPATQKSIRQLLEACIDQSSIRRYKNGI